MLINSTPERGFHQTTTNQKVIHSILRGPRAIIYKPLCSILLCVLAPKKRMREGERDREEKKRVRVREED